MPTLSEMGDGFYRTAFEEDRKGEYRLLVDTLASGRRFLISVALMVFAVAARPPHGDHALRRRRCFLRFVTFFDKIPALALLPILFIVFGLGEVSKIALIVIGVFPTIILDTYLRAKAVPRQQITKGLTLGASDLEVAYRIVLPQILPGVLDTIRLNFKAVILFLIAGESLAATVGLGYRIFVVRRYIAMDIIIPYVIWMSLLAFAADTWRCASSSAGATTGSSGRSGDERRRRLSAAARRRPQALPGAARGSGRRGPTGGEDRPPRRRPAGAARASSSPSSAPAAAASRPCCG